MSQPEPTITLPRPFRTRQTLIDACLGLLAEKSFDAITVQDICDRAAINRATFYRHFSDKDLLVGLTIRHMIQLSFRDYFPPDAVFKPDSVVRLIRLLCEFLDFLHTQVFPAQREQFRILVERGVREYIRGILIRWLTTSAGENSDDHAGVDLQSGIAAWAIFGAVQDWRDTPDREPAHAYAHRVYPLILSTIGIA